MSLNIKKISHENLNDFSRIDNSFEVSSVIELGMIQGEIRYKIKEVAEGWEKKYDTPRDFDPASVINNETAVIFLAYLDGLIAGKVVLKKYWNNFAYIDDIAVDRSFRRRGIGQQLLHRAISWAQEKGFPGIMLETQNINVGACKLYESCGFQIGGFDQLVYKAMNLPKDEIAIYWYLIF
ncbi:MAG: GNAT family N-acetyltransferase [Candidatus Hodarchaeales archaeon]|jgi:ribosomal protein S18 acetylase RimI-like enzyme